MAEKKNRPSSIRGLAAIKKWDALIASYGEKITTSPICLALAERYSNLFQIWSDAREQYQNDPQTVVMNTNGLVSVHPFVKCQLEISKEVRCIEKQLHEILGAPALPKASNDPYDL